MSGRRPAYRAGSARGVRFGEVPRELEARLEAWLDARHVEDGEVIKIQAVYRRGPWLIKFFAPSRAWKDRWRASPAVRCARLHERLAPIRTPAPLLALERREGSALGPSLLIEEFVEGAPLAQAFASDPRAAAALAPFMLAMHERRIFHGDFHPQNLLWTGTGWVLIDLVALRHPLRCLAPRRLILEQWASLQGRLDGGALVRRAFEDYVRAAPGRWELERDWARVLRLAESARARRR